MLANDDDKNFEFLGYRIKLSVDADRQTVSEVMNVLNRELEALPVSVTSNSEKLLLIALKVAADKVDQKNKFLSKIQVIENMIDVLPTFDTSSIRELNSKKIN